MNCPHCGFQFERECARFCPGCGTPLKDCAPHKQTKHIYQTPEAVNPSIAPHLYFQAGASEDTPPKRNTLAIALSVIGIAMALFAIGVAVFSMLRMTAPLPLPPPTEPDFQPTSKIEPVPPTTAAPSTELETTEPETTTATAAPTLPDAYLTNTSRSHGNVVNGNSVVVRDDKTYYIDRADRRALYVKSAEGVQRLCELSCSYLYVEEDYLYFAGRDIDRQTDAFYRIPLSGGGYTKIMDGDVYDIGGWNGYIYFTVRDEHQSMHLYRYLPSALTAEPVASVLSPYSFVADGKDIYFTDTGTDILYRSDFDGLNLVRLHDRPVYQLNWEDGLLYYVDSDTYRIIAQDPQTGERTALDSGMASQLNVTGEWMYYIRIDEGNALYRMTVDGSLRERLSDMDCSQPIALNGQVAFYSGDTLYLLDLTTRNVVPFLGVQE